MNDTLPPTSIGAEVQEKGGGGLKTLKKTGLAKMGFTKFTKLPILIVNKPEAR